MTFLLSFQLAECIKVGRKEVFREVFSHVLFVGYFGWGLIHVFRKLSAWPFLLHIMHILDQQQSYNLCDVGPRYHSVRDKLAEIPLLQPGMCRPSSPTVLFFCSANFLVILELPQQPLRASLISHGPPLYPKLFCVIGRGFCGHVPSQTESSKHRGHILVALCQHFD